MATRVDFRGLTKLRSALTVGAPPYRAIQRDISYLLLSFWKARYVRFSRGGGDWKQLAPATVKRKADKGKKLGKIGKRRAAAIVRQGKTGGPTAILIDNATLIGSLSASAENVEIKGQTMRVGMPKRQHEGDDFTLRKLADVHHRGLGTVPSRPIFVPPDPKTVAVMRRLLKLAVERILQGAQI